MSQNTMGLQKILPLFKGKAGEDVTLDALKQRQKQKEREEIIRSILRDYSLFGKIALGTWERRKRVPGVWPRRTLRGRTNKKEMVMIKALDLPEKHVLYEIEISLRDLPGLRECPFLSWWAFKEEELRKIAKWVFVNRRKKQ